MGLFKKPRILFAMLLIALMLVFLIGSLRYSPTMRVTPLAVSAIGIAGLLVTIAGEVFPSLGGKMRVNIMDAFSQSRLASKVSSEDEEEAESGGRASAVLMAWIIGFAVSIFFLGFPISVPLFMLGFMRFIRHVPWSKSIVVTVAVAGGLYIMFVFMLNIRVFEGTLFGGRP